MLCFIALIHFFATGEYAFGSLMAVLFYWVMADIPVIGRFSRRLRESDFFMWTVLPVLFSLTLAAGVFWLCWNSLVNWRLSAKALGEDAKVYFYLVTAALSMSLYGLYFSVKNY